MIGRKNRAQNLSLVVIDNRLKGQCFGYTGFNQTYYKHSFHLFCLLVSFNVTAKPIVAHTVCLLASAGPERSMPQARALPLTARTPYERLFWSVVLAGSDFAPGRHVALSEAVLVVPIEGCSWHLVGRGQGCC